MSLISTNSLLDLCRHGIKTKNESVILAASELSSWIVFKSLLEHTTEISIEMKKRVDLLADSFHHPEKYPVDVVPVVDTPEQSPEDGPLVA